MQWFIYFLFFVIGQMFSEAPVPKSLLQLHASFDGPRAVAPISLLETGAEVGVWFNATHMNHLEQELQSLSLLETDTSAEVHSHSQVRGEDSDSIIGVGQDSVWASSLLSRSSHTEGNSHNNHVEACNCDVKPGMPNRHVYKQLNSFNYLLNPSSLLDKDDVDSTWDKPAEDQGQCGSCYAKAITYSLQTRASIAMRKLGISYIVYYF